MKLKSSVEEKILPARVKPSNQASEQVVFRNVELTAIKTQTGEALVRHIPMASVPQTHGGKLTLEKNLLSTLLKFGTGKTLKNVSMDSPFNCWIQIENKFIKVEKLEVHNAQNSPSRNAY